MVEAELEVVGLGVLDLLLWIKAWLLSALSLASATRRALRCLVSSGEYFLSNLKRTLAWFLSRALENWAMAGGTLILVKRILFCLWKVMYLGHLTKRVRFLVGWMLLPTLKLRGLFSKSGFTFFSTFLAPFLAFTPLAICLWEIIIIIKLIINHFLYPHTTPPPSIFDSKIIDGPAPHLGTIN